MSNIYFTLTGTKYYYGKEFLEPDMELLLVKEPDDEHDNEAIKVTRTPLGQIGHVANSPYTVIGECMSAGRIYDKIGDKAMAKVMLITNQGVVLSYKVGTCKCNLFHLIYRMWGIGQNRRRDALREY